MERSEILEKLKEILLYEDDRNAELIRNCTEKTELVNDLGLASVSMLYLVISIEEAFQIRFDNVGIADFKTVGDVMDYIKKQVG